MYAHCAPYEGHVVRRSKPCTYMYTLHLHMCALHLLCTGHRHTGSGASACRLNCIPLKWCSGGGWLAGCGGLWYGWQVDCHSPLPLRGGGSRQEAGSAAVVVSGLVGQHPPPPHTLPSHPPPPPALPTRGCDSRVSLRVHTSCKQTTRAGACVTSEYHALCESVHTSCSHTRQPITR